MFCWKCGEHNQDRFAFCTSCSANLRSPFIDDPVPLVDVIEAPAARTRLDFASPSFASNISFPERKTAKLTFVLVAAFTFLIVSAIIAVLVWRQASASVAGSNERMEPGANRSAPSGDGENNSTFGKVARRPSKADEEFAVINGELSKPGTRDRKSQIKARLKGAESRYPGDYRFAYQSAKLEALTSKSHHEAFELLFNAGRISIETGKSADLLRDLQKDEIESLKRLTDHKEWAVLVNALRKNDAAALAEEGN